MKLLKYYAVALILTFIQVGAVMAQPLQTCTITTQNLVPGGVATAGSSCALNTGGMSVVSVQVTGTYTGALSGQVTTDNAVWLTLAAATAFTRDTTGAQTATIGSAVQDGFSVVVAGKSSFRITALGIVTGTATISMRPAASGGSAGGGGGGGGGAVTSTDGALTTIGTTTDAKSTATDATSVTLMQVNKQISASSQLTATAAGAPGDTKCSGSSSSCSLAASLKALQDPTTQLPTALGQTTASGSLSVVLASDATSVVAQGSTTSGEKGSLILGAVTTAAPSYTTAQTSPLSLDVNGGLRITGSSTTATSDTSRLAVSASDGPVTTCTATANAVMTCTPQTVPFDATGYNSFLIHVTVVGGTVNFEASNDNVTYIGIPCWNATNTGSSGTVSSTSATGIFLCPRIARYFQARVSGYGSGTPTALVYPSQKPTSNNAVVNGTVTLNSGQGSAGATAPTNPVSVSLIARTAEPTAVTTGQSIQPMASTNGKQVVLIGAVPELSWVKTVNLTDTTSTALNASGGAGIRNYVDWCVFSGIATTVATQIKILDGATLMFPYNMLAGSGNALDATFPASPLKGTAATAVNVQLSGSPTGAIDVTCGGHTAP